MNILSKAGRSAAAALAVVTSFAATTAGAQAIDMVPDKITTDPEINTCLALTASKWKGVTYLRTDGKSSILMIFQDATSNLKVGSANADGIDYSLRDGERSFGITSSRAESVAGVFNTNTGMLYLYPKTDFLNFYNGGKVGNNDHKGNFYYPDPIRTINLMENDKGTGRSIYGTIQMFAQLRECMVRKL